MSDKDKLDSGLHFQRKSNSTINIQENIDRQAEREAKALHKQGQYVCQQHTRQGIKDNYNKVKFDRLFRN